MSLTQGYVAQARGQWAKAARMHRALAERTNHGEAWHAAAGAYERLEDWPAAIECLYASLQGRGETAHTWRRIGDAHFALGYVDAALSAYERAYQLDPTDPMVRVHRGRTYWTLGRLAEAQADYEAALTTWARPCAAFNLSRVHELRGEWAVAHRLRESRFGCPSYAERHGRAFQRTLPQWDGTPTEAPLLIWCEEGVGDLIQHARFFPAVLARCPTLVIEAPSALHRLLAATVPSARYIDMRADVPTDVAFQCSASSLPALFDLNPATRWAPYLRAPECTTPWTGRPVVALCWAGSQRHPRDKERSMAAHHLLECVPAGWDWVSVQIGPRAEEWRGAAARDPLVTLPATADFHDTAALLMGCTAVVTVDTSVAHLAGALGVVTYVCVTHFPDPRWLLDREATPLYPTMRLFRQPTPGDWASVVTAVRHTLEER